MNERRRLLPAWLVLLVLGVGCGRKPEIRLPPPRPAVVGAAETGIASWYGVPYHGRRTSNGEVYDMNKLTAAHLSLPFGAWVRVANLGNGREVDVRINDRGPFVKNRVIDLSRAAAQQIGMLGPGTARVRMTVISRPRADSETADGKARALQPGRKPPTPASARAAPAPTIMREPAIALSGSNEAPCRLGPYYGVQVGSFREIENAQRLEVKMSGSYGETQIIRKLTPQGLRYRVVVGPASDQAGANRSHARLEKDRIPGFVALITEDDSVNCL